MSKEKINAAVSSSNIMAEFIEKTAETNPSTQKIQTVANF
jgi:hypothetical protein